MSDTVVLKRKRGRPLGSKNRARLDDDQQFQSNPKLKKVGVTFQFTPEQLAEIAKCSDDPVYFIEKYVKFRTLDRGITNVTLYDWQKELILAYKNNREIIVKTCRQAGKTSTTVGFILWYILFQKDKTVGVLAQKEKTATEIVTQIKDAYEEVPIWMQQGIVAWAATSIVLENSSRIISESTAKGAIRGFTINLLYCDEFAHVPSHIAEDFFTSVYPTISSGKTAKIIMTSTPLGLNLFYRFWTDANKRFTDPANWNDMVPINIHWSQVPGRDQAWAERMRKKLGEHKYMQDIEAEFLGSAHTLISGVKLRSLVFHNPLEQLYSNTMNVFERPIVNHSYVLSADCSEGKGLDYSTFTVFDVTTAPYRVVARFRDNQIEDVMFASAIQQTALHYNSAYVLVENNAIGALVLNHIVVDLDYDNCFFTMVDRGEIEATGQGKAHRTPGIRTTQKVKAQGCAKLKTIIETDQLVLNDFDLIQELSTFVLGKNKKWGAQEGTGIHDDTTTTLWLFAWLTTQDYFRDISDLNLRERLFADREQALRDALPPPPVHVINGEAQKPKLTQDARSGAIWIPADMSWEDALDELNGFHE